jgi:hypothetical protein
VKLAWSAISLPWSQVTLLRGSSLFQVGYSE